MCRTKIPPITRPMKLRLTRLSKPLLASLQRRTLLLWPGQSRVRRLRISRPRHMEVPVLGMPFPVHRSDLETRMAVARAEIAGPVVLVLCRPDESDDFHAAG